MKEYLQYMLFTILFVMASCVFAWLILATFSALMGGGK